MTGENYEIRLCQSCRLRYPLVQNHPFGERCPSCLGTTKVIATHQIDREAVSPPIETEIRLEALLDNIRSAWNVGSIFRTADGLGVRKLHLCGITPTPENESVTKTSLGAEKTVKWQYSRDSVEAAKNLKNNGYSLIALEQDERASAVGAIQQLPQQRLILIVGNEITGVDPDLLDLCNHVVHIPMRGQKKSFNVEVAFGIATYLLCSPT
jgi:tRNA G18 (ribose-2'-O)-methylase SpoU